MDEFALVCRRKIDDLGRVVIPKDVRNMFLIHDGDLLNISVSSRGVLISKRDACEDIVKSLTQIVDRINTTEDMSMVQKDIVKEYIEDAIRVVKGDGM